MRYEFAPLEGITAVSYTHLWSLLTAFWKLPAVSSHTCPSGFSFRTTSGQTWPRPKDVYKRQGFYRPYYPYYNDVTYVPVNTGYVLFINGKVQSWERRR